MAVAQDSPLWRIIGPGGGGAMFHPAISPHDPRRVLVACDMTGSYVTGDGGKSWRMFNLSSAARFFVFDPSDPNTLYAGAEGLWRSGDAGRSWSLIYPDPRSLQGLQMPGDHADVRIVTNAGPAPAVTALAVDPASSNGLYAAIHSEAGRDVYFSADRGRTWKAIRRLNEPADRLYIDPRSPREDRSIYVLGRSGVVIREQGKWIDRPGPESSAFIDVALGFRPGGPPILYGLTESRILLSSDAGATWHASELPGSSAQFRTIATSENHGEVAYISFSGLRLNGERYMGVARTSDAGATWRLVSKDTARAASPNVHDAWIDRRFGPEWGENPLSLGVSPRDPNICYATDLGRTLRTLDGGNTWEAVYSRRTKGEAYTTTGLNVTTAYGVHFDPFNPRRIFITYTDIGLFRSEDGGTSWISSTQGVPKDWLNTTYWVAFDPDVQGRMWAAASWTHDLPRPKMWRHASPSSFRGGVLISDDGARSWRTSNAGMPPSAITHIVLDPGSPKNARVLYAAACGRGVFKSVDGGKYWVLKNRGIEGNEPLAWRLALASGGTLYLVVARRSEHGEIGDGFDGALYKSTDGAEHWSKMNLPAGVNGPNGILPDAHDPKHLYLAAWRRATDEPEAGGGIFFSADGGETWTNVLARDQHIYDITEDPRVPGTFYACGFESSAWRSLDYGRTWSRIRGYNFKWGHRVIPDPADPSRIYITTFGGGVWHGPGAGDPHSMEDFVSPPVAYAH